MKRETRRKLLLLSTTGDVGGTERMVVNVAREFRRRGYSVRTVFTQS